MSKSFARSAAFGVALVSAGALAALAPGCESDGDRRDGDGGAASASTGGDGASPSGKGGGAGSADDPFAPPATNALPPALRDGVFAAVDDALGTPAAPNAREVAPAALVASGRDAWKTRRCAVCHGAEGRGDGKRALLEDPRPRDFGRGQFRYKSTRMVHKPTRADLVHYVGQAQHAELVAEADAGERDALAAFVIWLAMRGELERNLAHVANEEDELDPDTVADERSYLIESWSEAPSKVSKVPPAPWEGDDAARAAAAKRGEALFHDAGKGGCMTCHGKGGTLEGATAASRAEVRDLRRAVLRGGARPIDLYRRIECGLAGTKMPGFGGHLGPDDIWDLVAYTLSLRG